MSLAHEIPDLVWSDPQDLEEHARYWASKTIAERVIAGWELADRLDGHENPDSESQTRLKIVSVSRVKQSWR